MKYATLMLLVLLSGCGDDPSEGECANSLALGAWTGTQTGISFSIDEFCTYTDNYCKSTGRVPNITQTDGSFSLSITSSTVAGCLPAGNYIMSYAIRGDTLGLATTYNGVVISGAYRRE
jgi:hypothetical protein